MAVVRNFSSPRLPDWLWDQLNLLFIGTGALHWAVKQLELRADNSPHLAWKFIMYEAVPRPPTNPCMPSLCGA